MIVCTLKKTIIQGGFLSIFLLCSAYVLKAQCESIDTSAQAYNALIERWQINLERDMELAGKNVDTLTCFSIQREKWNYLFIIYLNTLSESTNSGTYQLSLSLINRLEKELINSYIGNFPLTMRNRFLIQFALGKAHFYYSLGDYPSSETICKASIATLDTMTLSKGVKNTFSNAFYSHIGGVANKMGNFEDAIGYYRKALAELKKKGGNNWTKKLLGDVFYNKGDYGRAIANYREVLDYNYRIIKTKELKELDERVKVANRIVNTNIEITNIYHKKKKRDSTFFYLDEAMNIHNTYANSLPLSILRQYGISLMEFEEYKPAVDTLQKVLKLQKGIYEKYHPELAKTYLALGQAYENHTEPQFEKAAKTYQLAIKSVLKDFDNNDIYSKPTIGQIEQSIFKRTLVKALSHKAQSLEKLALQKPSEAINLLQSAHQTLNVAIQTTDKIRTSFYVESDKQYLQEESYPIFEAAIRISEKLYQATGDPQYREHAFEVAEQSKSIILYDAIKNAGALTYANISEEKLAEERNLRLQLAALEKELQGEGKSREEQTKLEGQIFETKQAIKQFIQQLEKENTTYYDLKYKPNEIPLATIQSELLTGNQTLIEYFLGTENMYVFIVQSTGLPDLVTIPINESVDLNQLIDDFRASISNNEEEVQEQLAKQLYQQLFAPLEEKDLSEQVLIIPDGKLGSIPFDALIRADTYEKESIPYYLGLKYTFSYNYSATLLKEMKQRALNASETGVLGVAPIFPREGVKISAQSYGVLPLNESEVNDITEIVGGKPLVGTAANKAAFMTAAPAYPYLHLSTHGVVNNEQPRFSFVSFAQTAATVNQEELLYVSDLFNMSLNAEMVTLSACETGIGKAYRGEGMISLARGFAYAGTKSILPTLWAVNEQTTVKLMILFYQRLKEGKDKATALRLAKEELILKDKLNPYYWAGTIAIGDMRPIAYPSYYYWLGGLLSVLILGIGVYFFRETPPNKKSQAT